MMDLPTNRELVEANYARLEKENAALLEALKRLLVENEDYITINHLSAMGNVNLENARKAIAQAEGGA